MSVARWWSLRLGSSWRKPRQNAHNSTVALSAGGYSEGLRARRVKLPAVQIGRSRRLDGAVEPAQDARHRNKGAVATT